MQPLQFFYKRDAILLRMPPEDVRYFDQAVITAISGAGGDGMVHFRREKYMPRGGPDGGDGGKGGSVWLVAERSLNTLFMFRRQRRFTAEAGNAGAKSNKTGRSALDLEVKVPVGTLVRGSDGELLGDLVEPGQRVCVARGGRGGRGNSHFISVHNKAPRIADHGVPGEECELALELRLIADIGIVGVPNAGKSTFLAAISAARPKIAPYPFTTLVPNLGVADLGGFRTLVLADVPGLIEGAHAGVGLGFEFLRHIQRTRVLIHLLDGMAENPLADYSQIMSELALFDDALTDKPQIVALNKVDLPDVAARMPELRRKFARIKVELMGVSAVTGAGARELLFAADKLLASVPEPAESEVLPVYRPQPDPAAFAITREGERLWCLTGPRIERAAQMTFWEHHDSVRRFQRILTALGVQDSLTAAGAKNGDMVRIGDYQLEWNS